MGLDINLFRKEKGGDPEKVKESERKRGRNEEQLKRVDEVVALDELWRKSKLTSKIRLRSIGKRA